LEPIIGNIGVFGSSADAADAQAAPRQDVPPVRFHPRRRRVTTPFAITSPRTPYGLSDDPFFQEPLDPTDDTSRPVSLFVGRRAEFQLVAGQIVGNKHASQGLVQGAPGMGKTSLVRRTVIASCPPSRSRWVRFGTGQVTRPFRIARFGGNPSADSECFAAGGAVP
jgi:hypothetical protein